jgi:hypothetical protein
MSRRRLSVLLLLLVIPVIASAQRTGGRRSSDGGSRGSERAGAQASATISAKDLENQNPIELILDKKKDLGLSGTEVDELEKLNDRLKDSVKQSLHTIDSIAKAMKRTGDAAPTTGQMFIGRTVTSQQVALVRTQYEAALKDALTKLDAARQPTATALVEKSLKEQAGSRRGGSS